MEDKKAASEKVISAVTRLKLSFRRYEIEITTGKTAMRTSFFVVFPVLLRKFHDSSYIKYKLSVFINSYFVTAQFLVFRYITAAVDMALQNNVMKVIHVYIKRSHCFNWIQFWFVQNRTVLVCGQSKMQSIIPLRCGISLKSLTSAASGYLQYGGEI
jgi:hypothetical protein